MNKNILGFYTALLAMTATAVVAQTTSEQGSLKPAQAIDLPEQKLELAKPQMQQHTQTVEEATTDTEKTLSLSKEELVNYPDLVIRALIPALIQANEENVELLAPIYKQQQNIDPILSKWADALLARKQGDYAQSINLYRQLIAAQPQVVPVRFQLAETLFANNDNEAAEDQFQKLRTESLPEPLYQVIEKYLEAINKRDAWRFSGGMSYVQEPNINNAPKAGTTFNGFKAWDRESAQGFAYNFGAEKRWSLRNGFFTKLDLSGYGKYYWDNKKYNELSVRLGAGVGYRNVKTEISLTPFTERRWYGGGSSGGNELKRFSVNSGARIDLSHWITAKWQISTALEYGEQRYTSRKHLNGNNYLLSNTLLYAPNSNRYLFAGLDYSIDNATAKDDANKRIGLRIGWGEEWNMGLSTLVTLSYAKRDYEEAGRLLAEAQENREFSSQVSVWHRSVHFWGVTPRITWAYQHNKSNHPFYNYDKHRVYLDLNKRF